MSDKPKHSIKETEDKGLGWYPFERSFKSSTQAARRLELASSQLRVVEAERDEAEANHQAAEKALERAENALEELAEELDQQAARAKKEALPNPVEQEAENHSFYIIANTREQAASLAREKAAKLKGGGS